MVATYPKLFGYIGVPQGNEGSLVSMSSVAKTGDDYLIYSPHNGAPSPLSLLDLEYVTPAPKRLVEQWNPGEIILFAGNELVQGLRSIPTLSDFPYGWIRTPRGGHRMWVATPDQVSLIREHFLAEVESLILSVLRGEAVADNARLDHLHKIFLGISGEAQKKRFLIPYLIAQYDGDRDGMRLLRLRSVWSGVFESEEEFLAEVKCLKGNL